MEGEMIWYEKGLEPLS